MKAAKTEQEVNGFDEWWDKNVGWYLSDSLHMSEYHMASMVWEAALVHGKHIKVLLPKAK